MTLDGEGAGEPFAEQGGCSIEQQHLRSLANAVRCVTKYALGQRMKFIGGHRM